MSASAWLTIRDRGRLVIPKAIREDQGLHEGDRLIAYSDEHGVTLMTRDQLEARIRANAKEPARSLVDELIADRRAEALRDLAGL